MTHKNITTRLHRIQITHDGGSALMIWDAAFCLSSPSCSFLLSFLPLPQKDFSFVGSGSFWSVGTFLLSGCSCLVSFDLFRSRLLILDGFTLNQDMQLNMPIPFIFCNKTGSPYCKHQKQGKAADICGLPTTYPNLVPTYITINHIIIKEIVSWKLTQFLKKRTSWLSWVPPMRGKSPSLSAQGLPATSPASSVTWKGILGIWVNGNKPIFILWDHSAVLKNQYALAALVECDLTLPNIAG